MKKKTIVTLLITVLILTSAGCSAAHLEETNTSEPMSSTETSPETVTFDLADYKAKVSNCREKIQESSLDVGNVAKYIYNASKTLGRISDSFVDSGFEWLEENNGKTFESVASDYDAICDMYKSIVTMNAEGQEAEEIDSYFRNLFDSYKSLYDLATSPSGTVDTYASNINDALEQFSDSNEYLSLFLDE